MTSMTSRQRWFAALNYAHPDKIPVFYHASPAGLYVHGQKLIDLFNCYPPDNPVTFDTLPHPPPGTIDETGRYCERRTDEWGTTWEWLIYGLYGHPVGFPFASWEEARDYRFPPLPWSSEGEFERQKQLVAQQKKDYFTFYGGISILEKTFALCPLEKLLMDLYERPAEVEEFLDRMVDYWMQIIDSALRLDYDGIMFGDDWGTQKGPLISPKLFRNFFKPRYQKMIRPIKEAGKAFLFHSCGRMGELFDDFLDMGMDVYWPQIPMYDQDELVRKCVEHKVTLLIHPDRQHLIPLGTPQQIEATIRSYAERYHALGGGGILYVEIENDAPFENVRALVESVDRYR